MLLSTEQILNLENRIMTIEQAVVDAKSILKKYQDDDTLHDMTREFLHIKSSLKEIKCCLDRHKREWGLVEE
ncbi:MAG: hypothetical protein H7839_04905 [Magnetococcus sp. YQC-5]